MYGIFPAFTITVSDMWVTIPVPWIHMGKHRTRVSCFIEQSIRCESSNLSSLASQLRKKLVHAKRYKKDPIPNILRQQKTLSFCQRWATFNLKIVAKDVDIENSAFLVSKELTIRNMWKSAWFLANNLRLPNEQPNEFLMLPSRVTLSSLLTFLWMFFFEDLTYTVFFRDPTSNILPTLSRLIAAFQWCWRRLLPSRLSACHVSRRTSRWCDVWSHKTANVCGCREKCSHESDGIGKMLQIWCQFGYGWILGR